METQNAFTMNSGKPANIPNVVKIGDVEAAETRCVRIVHISDTHRQHNAMMSDNIIPDGDILIHSGDFGQYRFKRRFNSEADMLKQTREIDNFFERLPHRLKIFVAGNHETSFPSCAAVRVNDSLKHGVYLQDSYIVFEGIKIYGSPWTSSRWYSNAAAFSVSDDTMATISSAIPDDVDILVTHSPPYGIRDLACMSHWKNLWRNPEECESCNGEVHTHRRFARNHWGCPHLRRAVFDRVRPKAHLFGHVHGENGCSVQDGVVFSNAALKEHQSPTVLDFYIAAGARNMETDLNPSYSTPELKSNCVVM